MAVLPFATLNDWIGKFAAGQEACLFAVLRQNVRLGENFQQAVRMQCLNDGAQIQIGTERRRDSALWKECSSEWLRECCSRLS